MEIEQLKQFDTIARLGTMTAAARELNITQPALSRSIARLESELGIQLFERQGKRIALRSEGEHVLEYTRTILRDERLLRMAVDEVRSREGALTVATVAPAPLWRLTALCVERLPGQLLTSKMMSQSDMERAIINCEVDLAISSRPVNYPSTRCCALMNERLSLLAPRSDSLAKKRFVTSKDLDGKAYLLFRDIGFWGDLVRRELPNADFVVQQDYSVFEQLAKTSEALSFVSDAAYTRSIDAERHVVIPIEENWVQASFYLLCPVGVPKKALELFDWVEQNVNESRSGKI